MYAEASVSDVFRVQVFESGEKLMGECVNKARVGHEKVVYEVIGEHFGEL